MEKKKHNNPITGSYYTEKDFILGRTLHLGGWKFQLVRADEYTEKYMSDNPDQFPEACIEFVLSKIKKGGNAYPSLQEYVVDLMRKLDRNNDGFISFAEFTAGLRE